MKSSRRRSVAKVLSKPENGPPSSTASPAPAPSPAGSAAPAGVFLRGENEVSVTVPDTTQLMHLSRYWTYVVSNRLRLTEESRYSLQQKALKDFEKLGVPGGELDRLLQGNVVEVSMPYLREELGWESRVTPWESLLSLATKTRRKPDQHVTVVRHLRRDPAVTAPPRRPGPPKRLLLAVSAPGKLREQFDFTTECRLVESTFASEFGADNLRRLNNPSPAELQAASAEFKPDIIHLAGVDAHQKARLFEEPEDPLRHDGYMLRGPNGRPLPVGAEELGRILTGGGEHAPRLVCFNFYNSAARLAALTVACGAASSVGFQDTINDAVAEQFFSNLYTAWRELGWDRLLEAFSLSRQQMAATADSRNSGDVVLWNDTSTFAARQDDALASWVQVAAIAFRAAQPWLKAVLAAQAAKAAPAPAPPPTTPPAPLAKPAPPVAAPPPGKAAPAEPVRPTVEVRPLRSLNYSLLHNGRSLFDRFQIMVPEAGLPAEVEVRVELCAGEQAFPVLRRHRLVETITNLHDDIHLPLVVPLLRGRREAISTCLVLTVTSGGQTLYCDTHPVRLLPPDEWTDNPKDRRWLPSFILPRDPAVQRIVEGAQRYLRALADDSSAGFDGYQSVTGDEVDGPVDLQVRALWSALLYEHPVSYINPPPTYTADAQRIRTPSQVLEERRGTCIDLALLFAACLEYLGVMPVMFLIQGHAFPGYWRSPAARTNFSGFGNVADAEGEQSTAPPAAGRMVQEGWMVESFEGLQEITRAIQSGGLVPLETTEITRRGSFREALELGLKNLVTPWSFDAMVEIQTARDKGVTPLPLFNQEA